MKKPFTKGLITLLAIYIVLMLTDIGTTLINGEYVQHLESNPLYLLTGSMLPIIFFNLLLIYLLYKQYSKPNIDTRFFMINLITWLSVARLLAIKSAITIYNNPPTIEAAAALSEVAKYDAYASLVFFIMVMPIIITQIAYYLMKIDHKIVEK